MNIEEGSPPPLKRGRKFGRMYDPLMAKARERPGVWLNVHSRKKTHAQNASEIKHNRYQSEQSANDEVWDSRFRQDGRPGYYRLYAVYYGKGEEGRMERAIANDEDYEIEAEANDVVVPKYAPAPGHSVSLAR